jgi:DNA-binding GntR family transcriptional regulator
MAPRMARNLRDDKRFVELIDQMTSGYNTMGEMVYAILRESIMSGSFSPGEWLRQESIADAIGVSRIPVRTALLRLESEGVVTLHPHRGARVRTLSAAQIDEIYRLRVLLESYALRLSMVRMSPERLERLRGLADTLDAAPEGAGFADTRVEFYREAYDVENNPLLVEIVEKLRGYVGRYMLGFRFDGQHDRKHSTFVYYITAGDLTAAESWLRAHLEEVRSGILELSAKEDEPAPPRGVGGSMRDRGRLVAGEHAGSDRLRSTLGGPAERAQTAASKAGIRR